ncbi:MAG: zinc-ribbon domain-containing protein [Pseudomonadota bacterium]
MKLTCPNCAAQYEVPDEVIPETGRDVQCSACGDTWFQVHPNHPEYKPSFDPEAPEEDAEEDTLEHAWGETPESVAEADPEPDPEPEPEYEDAAQSEYEAETATDPYDEDEAPSPTPPRRDLPEEVTTVLKEEAELETLARESETASELAAQQDLSPGETQELERRSREAKARMARLRGFDDPVEEPVSDLVQHPDPEAPETQEPEIDLGTRANLLPQVDDVDHQIESQSEGAAEAAAARDGSRVATQKEKKGGFGRGLRISVILAVVAAGLYLLAPLFARMVPGLEAPLTSYTQFVDQGRAALQQMLGQ